MASAQSSFNVFFTFLLVSTFHLRFSFSALQENHSNGTYSGQINSNSVLVALLDSHYTELAELVEKALLLQTLEDAVGKHNITIFAPKNEALENAILILNSRGSCLNLAISSECSGEARWSDSWDRKVANSHESVQQDFNNRRSLQSISAVKPEGAPEVDPRTHRLKKPAPPAKPGSAPVLPIYDAMAPGPSLAPAPAPGPATEMGRLVSEGYVLTVLAPNDEAMAKLTTDQLSEPGAPEQIIYYHVIPEYQTEESMYNAMGEISVQGIDGVLFPLEEKEKSETKRKLRALRLLLIHKGEGSSFFTGEAYNQEMKRYGGAEAVYCWLVGRRKPWRFKAHDLSSSQGVLLALMPFFGLRALLCMIQELIPLAI
ncbi:fasciclin-like arabinogalactan protein 17 [Populus alba x Populus x berolinensis]|uniref:Fasciclin-like arabinogalactan protein 17 n=1 Tax=Populus alba x Populus x berolinensis TaxID=444605 RepID=A0AAD6ME19_9ROSI|nr:fasciclin-like arabinogalactan protein 17 [Populus alba x Populus x berolinensis]